MTGAVCCDCLLTMETWLDDLEAARQENEERNSVGVLVEQQLAFLHGSQFAPATNASHLRSGQDREHLLLRIGSSGGVLRRHVQLSQGSRAEEQEWLSDHVFHAAQWMAPGSIAPHRRSRSAGS